MLANINPKLAGALVLFHITVIALANYAVQFTGAFAGYHFTWGMFVFPLVILATDLTVRLSSQRTARLIVAVAYLPAILISAWLADWRIGIASGTAYLAGQLLDIIVFQKIRERNNAWWPAPLLSTLCANLLDTYTFYAIAFHRSTDPFMAANWFELATADLAFKVLLAILIFLPVYGVLLNHFKARMAAG